MKTILHTKETRKFLTLIFFNLIIISAQGQSFPYLSFTNATYISGTPLQKGAIYKFPGVTTGVDAFVTIQDLLNGATVTNIDQFGGVGYDGGFQPIVSSVAGSADSYAKFLIEFKNSDGTKHTFPNLAATGLDIDGTTMALREFCTIDMNGGSAAYQSTSPEVSLSTIGSAFKILNISGNNISGIDSTKKEVMFTVSNNNVSSLTISFGSVRTSGSGVRNYSAFFKNFQYSGPILLPVKLSSFTALLNNDHADLKWTTSSEKDVNYFSVEKSLDGKNYSETGVVFAKGNSSSLINYNFTDDNIYTSKPGVIYYRLRSVDIDGKYEYSEIRIIDISVQNKNALLVQAYPNPAVNELRITIPSNWQNKKVIYEIIGSNGMASKKITSGSASQTESINVSSLAPGFYFLKVVCNGEIAQQKIIKK